MIGRRTSNREGLFNLRSLFIIGALLTLCIAEGVGLQLLPLPSDSAARGPSEGLTRVESPAPATSTPIQDEYEQGRVVIAAPKPKRHLAQPEFIKVGAVALRAICEVQPDLLPGIYSEKASPIYSLVLARQPASRAPPGLA
jgi:hypothetical protein